MGNRVLVVAAHPDDEVLGAGGAIARHKANGDYVAVLIAAEGVTSRDDTRDVESRRNLLNQLKDITLKAHSHLGTDLVEFSNFPDNRMDSIDFLDIVKEIERFAARIAPNIVYTHLPTDLNIDHQILSKAVVTCFRPQPGKQIDRLLFFEVNSATNFQVPCMQNIAMNYFINIEKYLPQKVAALKEYSSEMRDWPHSRSYRALEVTALARGSSVGLGAAEAFHVAREIVS